MVRAERFAEQGWAQIWQMPPVGSIRVGSDYGGESCSIRFLEVAGNKDLMGKTSCRRICNSKPLFHRKNARAKFPVKAPNLHLLRPIPVGIFERSKFVPAVACPHQNLSVKQKLMENSDAKFQAPQYPYFVQPHCFSHGTGERHKPWSRKIGRRKNYQLDYQS